MTGGLIAGITLDAGGPTALDLNDRRMLVLLARAGEEGVRVTIPATSGRWIPASS